MTTVWVVQIGPSESLKIKEDTKLGVGSKREWIWEELGKECVWEYDVNIWSKILKNIILYIEPLNVW